MRKVISILMCLFFIIGNNVIVANAETNVCKCISKMTKQVTEMVEDEVSARVPEYLGNFRVTTYCPACNDPSGYQSSSGVTLYEGCVACNWLPNGTKLIIDGNEYVVMDYCGTEAIDIFVDTAYCQCALNTYKDVYIKRN